MTLLETIIAMAIMVIIFAAILPQFNNISKSWAAKQANAEVLQNARVLTDHLRRNLSTAVRITSVSDSTETDGYIEFEDNDGVTFRYELPPTPSSYVKFGPVGSLSDLAGPVSQLQFICYDDNDLDTPINPGLPVITDVDLIRAVRIQTTVTDSSMQGRDQSLNNFIYLQANNCIAEQSIVVEGSKFEFDYGAGDKPKLAMIDETHFLCAYAGVGLDGWVSVFTIDLDAETVTLEDSFEFDTQQGNSPALAKIDNEHFICAYNGQGSDGWAVVFTVDNSTWMISKETPFKFDNQNGQAPELIKIDNSHYLCTYRGFQGKPKAVILIVDLATWQISQGTPLQLDTLNIENTSLAQIDTSHYLCVYSVLGDCGKAVVLTTDTVTDTITAGSAFEFISASCRFSSLAQIDADDFLCVYCDQDYDGNARILRVDTGTWQITAPAPVVYNPSRSFWPSLAEIDQTQVLCAWDGFQNEGVAAILNVDAATGSVIPGPDYSFDTIGQTPDLHRIDDTHYLGVYKGQGGDGWGVIIDIRPLPKP
jgi:type II secretory pathway pseudopilin PulG